MTVYSKDYTSTGLMDFLAGSPCPRQNILHLPGHSPLSPIIIYLLNANAAHQTITTENSSWEFQLCSINLSKNKFGDTSVFGKSRHHLKKYWFSCRANITVSLRFFQAFTFF